MAKISRALIFSVLFWVVGANAWAGPTITVYFGGTGVWSGWAGASSKIGAPELLTTLANIQATLPDQYKVYIPGVGVDYAGNENVLTMANPSFPFPGTRGWDACMDEAANEVRRILVNGNDSDAIVNLVGWSRGGATAIAFVKKRLTVDDAIYSRISRINILALDPVTGDSNALIGPQLGPDYFILPDKVADYIGIYADDERSVLFGPVLPKVENTEKTRTYLFRVPGSHETLVGNRWTHGHSTYGPGGLSDLLNLVPEDPDDRVRAAGWVTKVFVKELLGTPGWGNVRFNTDGVDNDLSWKWAPENVINDSDLKSHFLNNVSYMHGFGNYDGMRNFSFAQPALGWEYFGTNPFSWFDKVNSYSILQWPANVEQRPLQKIEQNCWLEWFQWKCSGWKYGFSGLSDNVPDQIGDGLDQYDFLYARGGMRSRYIPTLQ